tara:strand:- start:91 stop:705 length:615 start_codon:yes stop_codon:yes gene_type:complete
MNTQTETNNNQTTFHQMNGDDISLELYTYADVYYAKDKLQEILKTSIFKISIFKEGSEEELKSNDTFEADVKYYLMIRDDLNLDDYEEFMTRQITTYIDDMIENPSDNFYLFTEDFRLEHLNEEYEDAGIEELDPEELTDGEVRTYYNWKAMIKEHLDTDYDPYDRYVCDERRDEYISVEEDEVIGDLTVDIFIKICDEKTGHY